MDNSVDSVEISAAAQLLYTFEQRGIVLVNKEQHDELVATRYYCTLLRTTLDKLLDPENKLVDVIDAINEFRKMREAGWFE